MKMSKAKKEKKPEKRVVQFPGIGAQAEALGVSRVHLWKVLTGRRNSRSLSRRYKRLTGGAK